jgi:hypothetical protein
MMDEKFTSDVSGWGNGCPGTFLPAMEATYTVQKYLMKFDDNDYMMATLRSVRNEMYKVQEKGKKQQCTVMYIPMFQRNLLHLPLFYPSDGGTTFL